MTGKPTDRAHARRLLLVLQHAFGTGQDRHLRLLHRLAGFFLLAHEPHGFGSGSDELDVRSAANLGEVRVLTQQAVAGMNGIDIGDFRSRDDGGHIQIALRRSRRPDADGFVGKADVERVAVRLAVDGNRADPQFLAGADDAKCDFAAVGDEQFSKHRFQSGPGISYSCCDVYGTEGSSAAAERKAAGRIPPAGRW